MTTTNPSLKTDADIHSVINFIPSALLWIDQQHNIKDVNDHFLAIVDMPREKVIGTSLTNYPLQNLNQYFSHIDLLRNRDIKIVDNFEINNEKKTVRFYIQDVVSENAFMVMGIDISNEIYRTEAHEEIKRQEEENTRFMLIGQIATGVAHEINNPLAILSGFLFNMKRSLEHAEEKIDRPYLLDKISKASINIDRIAMIVRGLKFLAKNDLKSPLEKVHIQEVLNTALESYSEKFSASGITLKIAPVTSDMIIDCRVVQLAQVLINLLSNAHDAVKECSEKWVHVDFEKTEKNFLISVTDSGPGIPKEIKNKIMQPFFSTKFANKGVGLGLSTSKIIVKDHNGELLLDESSSDTKFVINLRLNHADSF